jgi:hypothetical protein
MMAKISLHTPCITPISESWEKGEEEVGGR